MTTTRKYLPGGMAALDGAFFTAQRGNLLNVCERCNENGTDFDVCWYCMTDEERNA